MIEYGRLDEPRGALTRMRAKFYSRVAVPTMRKHGLDPERYAVEILIDDNDRPHLGPTLRRTQRVPPIPRPPRGARLLDLLAWTEASGR
jgi:hypothetical protein